MLNACADNPGCETDVRFCEILIDLGGVGRDFGGMWKNTKSLDAMFKESVVRVIRAAIKDVLWRSRKIDCGAELMSLKEAEKFRKWVMSEFDRLGRKAGGE